MGNIICSIQTNGDTVISAQHPLPAEAVGKSKQEASEIFRKAGFELLLQKRASQVFYIKRSRRPVMAR